jgi:hypothetical protein
MEWFHGEPDRITCPLADRACLPVVSRRSVAKNFYRGGEPARSRY